MARRRILVVKQKSRFRDELVAELKKNDYRVNLTDKGSKAIDLVRSKDFDVAILRLRMPDIDGVEVLKQIKQIRPYLQVIILTDKGTIKTAMDSAHSDVYEYIESPCEVKGFVNIVDDACEQKLLLQEKADGGMPADAGFRRKAIGISGFRPLFIILGLILLLSLLFMPIPNSLRKMVGTANITGYAELEEGETITDYVSGKITNKNETPLTTQQVAFRAKAMIAILVISGLFWATEAIPLAITAFLVALLMYVLNIMPPDLIAKSFMKDAVFFIIGALGLAVGVRKTGLDKRLGLIILGRVNNRISYLFVFGPLAAVAACFISAKCLIAFLVPVLMSIYAGSIKEAGLKRHRPLGTFLILVLVYATAMGGTGAPTVGARNAIMIGLLDEAGSPINFIQWMKYGMPFVPIGALAVGAYLYLIFNKKIKLRINPGERVRQEARVLGKFGGKEARMAFILVTVIALWIGTSHIWGLGGPALAGLLLMILLRIVNWQDIEKGISWEVVWLYAGACALGAGLMLTGAALWLALGFIDSMPDALSTGNGLLVSVSILTSTLTNFMSDGAAVALVGPITLSMAKVQDISLWQVGLATAFSSSFAHCMVIGRPGLAIAYAMSKDPKTGERLLQIKDLLIYGIPLLFISWLLMWGCMFWGYWRWLSWPH